MKSKITTKRYVEKTPYKAYYYSYLENNTGIIADGRTKAESIYNINKLIRSLIKIDKNILNN